MNLGKEGKQEANRSGGTNNKMQLETKLVERWYARSYRVGDHKCRPESGISRLWCHQSRKKVDKYMCGRWGKWGKGGGEGKGDGKKGAVGGRVKDGKARTGERTWQEDQMIKAPRPSASWKAGPATTTRQV